MAHWPNVWMHSSPFQWAAYVFICIHNIHSPYDQHHHTSVSPLSSPFQTMPQEWARLKTVTKSLDMSQVKSKHRRWARSPAWKLWSPPSYGMTKSLDMSQVKSKHRIWARSPAWKLWSPLSYGMTKSLVMSHVKSKHRRWARSLAWKLWSPSSYGKQSGSINGSVTYLHSLCITSIWQTPSTSSSLPLFLSSTNCSKNEFWWLIKHQKCVMSQKGGMEGFGSNNFMFKDTCLIMKYNHVLIIVQSTY